MKAMILAAGYGTRFRPATYEIPKPMVPLCNRPLIGYAVESLLAAGVREIVINLHHLPEQLETYLRTEYANRCTFHFSFEPEILGTGGGVRKVRSVLDSDEGFFLVNGDTIQFPPFDELRAALRRAGAVAALSLRQPPRDDRFTPVMFDEGYVTGFGTGPGEPLMFSGAHAVSRRIFDHLPEKDFSGLTEDVYIPLTRNGSRSIAAVIYDGVWFDIGTPRRYLSASGEMLGLMTAGRIEPPSGSRLSGSSLIAGDAETAGQVESSSIGARSKVESGAHVIGSVLWDDVTIRENVEIRDSVIGHGVTVEDGARIKNALICRRLPAIEYAPPARFFGSLVAVAIDAERPLLIDLRGS